MNHILTPCETREVFVESVMFASESDSLSFSSLDTSALAIFYCSILYTLHCKAARHYESNEILSSKDDFFPSSLFTFRPFRWPHIRLQSSQPLFTYIRQNPFSPSHRVRFHFSLPLSYFPANFSNQVERRRFDRLVPIGWITR